jgi:hypothetical protein
MNMLDQTKKDSSVSDRLLTSHDRDRRVEAIDRGASSTEYRTSVNSEADRILLLEAENMRLRQLVAELLVRNQQVREMSLASSHSSDSKKSD